MRFKEHIGSQSDCKYSIKYCRCSYSHHIVELFNFPGNNWQDCQYGGSEKGRNGSCMDTMHSQKVQAFSFSEYFNGLTDLSRYTYTMWLHFE